MVVVPDVAVVAVVVVVVVLVLVLVVVVDTSFLMLTSSAFLHHLFLTTEDTHLGPNMEDSLDVEQSLGPSQVGKMVIDPSRVIQLLVKGQNK